MAIKISLLDLKVGEKAVVVEVVGGAGTAKRLSAMGLKIGIEIKKVSAMFMRGPITVKTGHMQIAIGHGLASKIIVEQKR